jgi:hypothetical protein
VVLKFHVCRVRVEEEKMGGGGYRVVKLCYFFALQVVH